MESVWERDREWERERNREREGEREWESEITKKGEQKRHAGITSIGRYGNWWEQEIKGNLQIWNRGLVAE